MNFYAHTHPEHPDPSRADRYWEPLFTAFEDESCSWAGYPACEKCKDLDPSHGHLNKVAWWTAKFMQDMFPEGSEDAKTAAEWGYLAGLWHDLGKFAPEWQEYLKRKVDPHIDEVVGKVDHSTTGAQFAIKEGHSILGHILAYAIAGHHSGLLDSKTNGACQTVRLTKEVHSISEAPEQILSARFPQFPEFLAKKRDGYSAAFFTRMLFSALVDADFLATESFMNVSAMGSRNRWRSEILFEIEQLVQLKIESFGVPSPDDIVNLKRKSVVDDCVSVSEESSGLFTLAVPTGGGKTLASLLFAVRHAIKNKQNRIIFVVPFTSIIEQNAEVIRKILGPLQTDDFTPLIEHHASLSPEKETEQSRLASENWDAPIVITTAVQFYESFHACKTSESRKLHNIANSVVIFDEAQTLPVNYLRPCLRLIEELTEHYHSTVVLCTATQPAIHFSEDFPIGLKNCRSIIRDTDALFNALKRVEITHLGTISDRELADELLKREQVLCIVNRRRHAQELFRLLPQDERSFHLSALMCPQHRSEVLERVRSQLKLNEAVRLVSTQLIEAGVDVDFPVVYRSMAGIDSIAQSAGRCNRNGKLNHLGSVFVFDPEAQDKEAYFRETAQVAKQIFELHEDVLGELAVEAYFELYYYKQRGRWDEKQILDQFRLNGTNPSFPFEFKFETVAKNFKLIDEWQQSVIVPFDQRAKQLISRLGNPQIPLTRSLLRALQRYTVQVNPKLIAENESVFEFLRDGQFAALISCELHYSNQFGLTFDESYSGAQSLFC